MRRTTVWLWITGGVLAASIIVVLGGWAALRQWPTVVGPHLPPSLAYAMADWGAIESVASRACFGDLSEHWMDHPMTPTQADARNAVLCAQLHGTRERQLAVLDFIGSADTGFVRASSERDALVFSLTKSPDHRLRERARRCWEQDGPKPLQVLRRLTPAPDDHSLLSPDGWIAGPGGAVAWQMLILQNTGYDHQTPNRYRHHLKNLLKQLSDNIRSSGPLLADPRDNAIALLVITDAYAMTNDPGLKPVVERGRDALVADLQRLERLWLEDTTSAVLTAMVYRALLAAGIETTSMHSSLSTGIDAWWAGTKDADPPPWFARGRLVDATMGERWGALTVSLTYIKQQPSWAQSYPTDPPPWIADPSSSTPLGRYLIRLSAYYPDGEIWDRAFAQRRDTLFDSRLITPGHQPPEEFWPPTTAVSGTWETVFALLELGIYRAHASPKP